MTKVSIIIPTFNKVVPLSSCIDSIIKCTNLDNVEVIIVSNGCRDQTVTYVNSLGPAFKVIHWDEPIGYPRAINVGICVSKGEYIVLLNNDTVLFSDKWLDLLLEPFNKFSTAAVTSPVVATWNKRPWGIFFCAAVKKEVFDKIGLLDIVFSPGLGEDIDFCLRAGDKGYTIHQVPLDVPIESEKGNYNLKRGGFPIWHEGYVTFRELENEEYTKKQNASRELLIKRYGIQYPE